MVVTKTLRSYSLDIFNVEDFKEYYYNNLNNFSTTALNSFLKALDIPAKFFKEQPMETKDELLGNREIFVRENKKFLDKVIVVVRHEDRILNACRMSKADAELNYEKLKSIEEVSGLFEHRSFMKDGYISLVLGEIKPNVENKVLCIDFPILLNKSPMVHRATYTLPNDDSVAPIEHIHYLSTDVVDLLFDFKDIKSAIEHFAKKAESVSDSERANEQILRDPDVVALALQESGVIPSSYTSKMTSYIIDNVHGVLDTNTLESLVLDFDENFKSYKQVTALRSVDGSNIVKVLESSRFKEFVEEMQELEELTTA